MDIEGVPGAIGKILPKWAVVGPVQVAQEKGVIVIPTINGTPFSVDFEAGQKLVLIKGSGNQDIEAGSIGEDLLFNMPLPWGAFVSGKDGRVLEFVWGGPLVKSLFRAEKMELSEFVQNFVDAYKIPQMNVADDFSYWSYTAEGGFRVMINNNWLVQVERVLSDAESKQAFD